MVSCPQCGASIEWIPQNRYRPFCSERCKLMDLGAWATERYQVPVAETEGEPETSVENPAENSPRPN